MPTTFHCLIHLRGRPIKVAVWNGIKNYKNPPPTTLLGMEGEVSVRKIRRTDYSRKIRWTCRRTFSREKFLKDLAIMAEDIDSIVLWTANNSAYRVFVNHLKSGPK